MNTTYKRSKKRERSILTPLILIMIVVIVALFVSQLIYGKNSYRVYQTLKEDKRILQNKISKLKETNANLQMQYFELKSVLPTENEDEI
ncbi:MAG: hypothetical protein DSZ06_03695 [Sulfurospirillum sp.]|nr:MAG: hypothetical protein DSZ06_03695 [Sulfurospirillum sp.]